MTLRRRDQNGLHECGYRPWEGRTSRRWGLARAWTRQAEALRLRRETFELEHLGGVHAALINLARVTRGAFIYDPDASRTDGRFGMQGKFTVSQPTDDEMDRFKRTNLERSLQEGLIPAMDFARRSELRTKPRPCWRGTAETVSPRRRHSTTLHCDHIGGVQGHRGSNPFALRGLGDQFVTNRVPEEGTT
jgi:hypothetical protein